MPRKKLNRNEVSHNERCKTCEYRTHLYSGNYSCEYYLKTGIRRGCEVINCNKYLRRTKKKMPAITTYFKDTDTMPKGDSHVKQIPVY